VGTLPAGTDVAGRAGGDFDAELEVLLFDGLSLPPDFSRADIYTDHDRWLIQNHPSLSLPAEGGGAGRVNPQGGNRKKHSPRLFGTTSAYPRARWSIVFCPFRAHCFMLVNVRDRRATFAPLGL
jgi:hypothetical protein